MRNVQITTTDEEVAKQYLHNENLCAIKWDIIEELAEVYRQYGQKVLVFEPDKLTYKLWEKENWKILNGE